MANEFQIKHGLVVSGSADIEQDLIVHGTITADQLNIAIVSSSVMYESGSTKFGDSIDDNHDITGSVNITGSINLNGQAIGTGKLDETTFNSFTSSYTIASASVTTRLGDLETFSSSLDGNFVTEGEFGTHTGSMNSFTSSTLMTIGALNTESSSIRGDFNTFTSSYTNVSTSIDSRLDTLETLSGSFTGSFSGSFNGDGTNLYNIPASGVTGLNLTQIADGSVTASVSNTNGLRVNSKTEITGSLIVTNGITGSIDYSNITNKPTLVSGSEQVDITGTTGYSTFSSSVSTSIGELSSSVATITNDLDGRLDNLETSTGSLNSFTSSINTTIKDKLNTEGVISGSVQVNLPDVTGFSEFSSSISSSVTTIFVDNFEQDGRLDTIETSTGSLNSFTSSINTTIKDKLNTDGVISGSVQVNLPDVTGYSTFSSSVSTSIGELSSSVATTDNTQNGRLSSLETESGSIRSDFNTYTGSNDTTNTTQNNRLNSLEGISGSFATTGSNSFNGSQTITGSLTITDNLTVLGSSSIIYSTASQLIVEDNVIVVNASYPAERFAGLEIHDSGSNGSVTASLFWDGLNNRFIYRNTSDAHYGGAMFIAGPRNTGSLGDEPGLTSGRLPKSIGGDHIGDSIINEISGSISISGSLEISGSIISTITPLVSGSSQISFNGITDKPTLVSGSEQIDLTSTTNYSSGIKTRLNAEGVISGSSQVSFGMISAIPSGIVSGSSQVLYSGLTGIPSGIVSGSSQISFNGITDKPTLVSGSGQIIYSGLTGIPSGIISGSSQVLNGSGIWSGSAQLPSGVVSGSGQISFSGISGVPSGLVSGSSQVLNGSGIVSGSSQISYIGLSNIPTGIVSGSSQVLSGTTIHSGSFFNGISVVSGSAQISFSGISGVPSGLVSGSGQISLASTSGFGTYLNQAVLTTSSPTFSSVNATTFTGALSGNASTATNATFATNSSKLYSTDSSYSYTSGAPYYGFLTYDGTYWQFKVSPATPENVRVYTADRLGGYSYSASSGANTIVQRDTNGYIQNSYFYTSGGGSERNASGMSYFAGFNSSDYYIRSYTAAAVATLLSGQSMNISGTATNITAYTINQNVGTANGVTFAGLTVNGNTTLGSTNGHYTRMNDTLYLGASDSGDSHFYFGEDSSGWYGSYWYWDSSYNHYWYSRYAGTNTLLMYHDTRETTNVYFQRHILPTSNNAYNLGSASLGWANIYTNDLHLSNMNKPGGNEIDGTNGTWTIQEGAENLYIINNRNNKKFKITLEEII